MFKCPFCAAEISLMNRFEFACPVCRQLVGVVADGPAPGWCGPPLIPGVPVWSRIFGSTETKPGFWGRSALPYPRPPYLP